MQFFITIIISIIVILFLATSSKKHRAFTWARGIQIFSWVFGLGVVIIVILLGVEYSNQKKSEKELASTNSGFENVTEYAETAVEREERTKQEAERYIKNYINVYAIQAEYVSTTLHPDMKVPGLRFKLSNSGQKSLCDIKVTCYFKNKYGRRIAEQEFKPVRGSSRFRMPSDDKPLRPDYIWELPEGRVFTAQSIPSDWEEGSVDVVVTDIEFLHEP